jgi:hypothetical protein
MRSFIVMRLVAATNAASGLSMAVGYPSAAQDDEENGRTAAQDVRELVLKERERVLAYVASIMAGDEESTDAAETVADEANDGDVEADDGEADDEGADEADDGEREDEGGEKDESVGGENCELAPGATNGGEDSRNALASDEAGDGAPADEAGGDEEGNGASVGGEVKNAQPTGGATDSSGDQEICALPSTGTGSIGDSQNLLSAFAVLAAVAAAGFGLRQRFI